MILLLLLFNILSCFAHCPCADKSLCAPLQIPPRPEIFIFSTDPYNWIDYHWSLITTVAIAGDYNESILCKAHHHDARVVFLSDFPVAQLSNDSARHDYIESLIQQALNTYTDGVNIDIEEPIAENSIEYEYLTILMKEIKGNFSERIPGTQVTFDVAWSPKCIDGRCYNYAALANYTDFLFIMAYDLRSQIFGPCTASANSAAGSVYNGIEAYLKLGIASEQLVLGVPWYGYDYTCLNKNSTNETICFIEHVPFRGVNCSDAAGVQIPYYIVREILENSTTGRIYDGKLQSPYFDYVDNEGFVHQVWYDDPHSLELKIKLAKALDLRGVGNWEADQVYYGDNFTLNHETNQMWRTFNVFF